jgi:K+-transporting ATPase ATPase C chain
MAVVLFTALTVVYVVATTLFDNAVFHHKAEGSFVKDAHGTVVGSRLIGQNFTKTKYFHPRPSADDYASGPDYSYGSNYGPTDPRLVATCLPVQKTDKSGAPVVDAKGDPVYETNPDGSKVCDPNTVAQRVKAYREENHLGKNALVPVDAVTASGSGLDPDITVANAKLQAPRVAAARGLPLQRVRSLIETNTDERTVGILGEPAVNVLALNLALDKLKS